MRALAAGLLVLALGGCVTAKDAAQMIAELKGDPASACIALWAGAGAGALTIMPTPSIPMAGGMGYLFIGRSNEPGSEVTVNNAGCWIKHGQAPVP